MRQPRTVACSQISALDVLDVLGVLAASHAPRLPLVDVQLQAVAVPAADFAPQSLSTTQAVVNASGDWAPVTTAGARTATVFALCAVAVGFARGAGLGGPTNRR